jgi:hypothetical protein
MTEVISHFDDIFHLSKIKLIPYKKSSSILNNDILYYTILFNLYS